MNPANNFIISKLCLENYMNYICNENQPIEIITIIMKGVVDSLQLGVYGHDDNYYLMMNECVYSIPFC